ncbi:MAG: hypothetical protein DHS20C18_45140 [Saprospiraceae bacterium]|nr:MAG: hypothetical protein DHS20C18_45140 [Saprospiraceae bacterium]
MEDQPPKTNDPKIVAIITYLTLVGLVIAFVLNNPKNSFVSFHMRQSLGIYLLFIVSSIVMIVPVFGWIAGIVGYLVGFVFWLIGLLGAIQEEEKLIPTDLGPRFQEWFQGI